MQTKNVILVVDDDPEAIRDIFDALSDQLEEYSFLQANNGLLAAELAVQKIPRLIISDWEMPGINGFQLLQELKNKPITADIPVLMATGVMTDAENLSMALEAGAADFIRKPFNVVELRARVNNLLSLSAFVNKIKQMNLEMDHTNRFLENLINIIPFPLIYYDKKGKIVRYNRSFALAFEVTNDIRKSYYSLFDETSAQFHKHYDIEILNGKKDLVRYECRMQYADATTRDLVFTKVPVWESEARLNGILGVFGDLTDLKKMHEIDLQQKKNELTNISMKLVQYSQLNEKLLKDVEQLKESNDPKSRKLALNIEKNYRLAMNKSLWSEFEKRFNDVHVDFYNKLAVMHRNLTPNERKLLAFLKMGLSSKEISAITFQNVKSIDMARYRLRKKIGIENNESFQSYLSRFV